MFTVYRTARKYTENNTIHIGCYNSKLPGTNSTLRACPTQIYPGNMWDDYTELYGYFNPECYTKAGNLLKRNMPNITSRTTKHHGMLKNMYSFIRGQYWKLLQNVAPPANLPAIWRYTAELLKAFSNKQLLKCQNLWPYARNLIFVRPCIIN